MKIIQDHIPKDTQYYRRPFLPMGAAYITIHSTANPTSTARNERAWLTNPTNTRQASYHIVVDDKEAIEVLPLNEVAWHAGDGNGQGNRGSIGIEICESGNRTKTLENAVELVAHLLKQRGWGVDRLRRHWDWSRKSCPRILMDNNWALWEKFKAEVEKKMTPIPAISVLWNGRRADHVTARLLNGRTEILVSGQWIALRDLANIIPGATLTWNVTTQQAEVKVP